MLQENIHECLYNPREGEVFLKCFLNMAKAEFTSEMFMHFYIKVKNKFLNANSQST